MYPLVKINYRYFIGYLYDDFQIKPLHIMLPKTRVYARSHDGRTEWIYFLIEDDDILEKYNTIWDKISADIKKEFGSKTACNNFFFGNQNEASDFHDKKIPETGSNHTSLAVIMIDSALKNKNKKKKTIIRTKFFKKYNYNEKEVMRYVTKKF